MLLPRQVDGLSDLERTLTSARVTSWLATMAELPLRGHAQGLRRIEPTYG